MQTVLREVEMILKSMPLNADDTREETITPNHLLFGRKINPVNYDDELNIRVAHSGKRLKHIELVLAHFWKRWSSSISLLYASSTKTARKIRVTSSTSMTSSLIMKINYHGNNGELVVF